MNYPLEPSKDCKNCPLAKNIDVIKNIQDNTIKCIKKIESFDRANASVDLKRLPLNLN